MTISNYNNDDTNIREGKFPICNRLLKVGVHFPPSGLASAKVRMYLDHFCQMHGL